MKNTHCQNCNSPIKGSFCTECGQKSATHRIDFHEIIHDITHSILHIDKGFFYTLIELSLRPGQAIVGYLAGKRVKHFKPIAYTLVLSGIFLLITHSFLGISHANEQDNIIPVDANAAYILGHYIGKYADHYLGFVLLLYVPFVSLFSWLFFKKSGYNYWENLTINTYIIGHFNIIMLFTKLIVALFFPKYIAEIALILGLMYQSWAYFPLFSKGAWLNRILIIIMPFLALFSFFISTWFIFYLVYGK